MFTTSLGDAWMAEDKGKKYLARDFPGGPVVRALRLTAEGQGLISGQGTKIP